MSEQRDPTVPRPRQGRQLKRLRYDETLWAKIVALWHRERVREEYEASGWERSQARKKANQEALEVARQNGWRGEMADLKGDLAQLLTSDLPSLGRRTGGQYWEEMLRDDLLALLGHDPAMLRTQLMTYLRDEVRIRGRFSGREGFYKMALIISYTPCMDHIDHRNAFVEALTEIGHDEEFCDPELFKVLMKFLRAYTHKPFETRLGLSMPGTEPKRFGLAERGRRWLFGQPKSPRASR
ncbi:MAG: hypothetical protein OEV00_02075 [Acidobacteriota bacterium]|nr:hypothetical protein [Acidobacteriota bacterium]MDH3784095.1 hypothetical protein [Acidobacteriota bacterium]